MEGLGDKLFIALEAQIGRSQVDFWALVGHEERVKPEARELTKL